MTAVDEFSPVIVSGSETARSQWGRAWDRFRSNRLALASLVFCLLLVLLAIMAPVLASYGYAQTNYEALLAPTGTEGHLLGTDQLGRDILSRLIFSLRTALVIAFAAEFTAVLVALLIGLTAGYVGGRVEQLLMGITDIGYAFPSYLFAILLVTVMGRSMLALALAIGVASWVTQARLVRAQVLSIKVREYVEAARAMGAGGFTIAVRYILPNAVGPILVTTSFGIPAAIVAESGLALLGLGVPPPTPSWGTMILDGTRYVGSDPQMLIWPVLLFAGTMLAFAWLGDGLRDAFDVSG